MGKFIIGNSGLGFGNRSINISAPAIVSSGRSFMITSIRKVRQITTEQIYAPMAISGIPDNTALNEDGTYILNEDGTVNVND